MKNSDIKRLLGVGMATMSNRLLEYKDPFEPTEPQLSLMAISGERFTLCKQSCIAQDCQLRRALQEAS